MRTIQNLNPSVRLLSLDVIRGLIMILLAAESARVYQYSWDITDDGITRSVVGQFFHHPWHGLRFWDLVQPGFMMIAGTAMYISYERKASSGVTWAQNFRHIAIRCFRLLLLGLALHCIFAGKIVFELWNVLSQLAVTTMIAYLIIRRSATFQLVFSIALLVITEILYRYTNISGYDQPFVADHNFGSYMDVVMMGKINTDGWVAFNFIPTAAHTIWGVLAGKLLVDKGMSSKKKLSILLAAAVAALVAGFALDLANITPIIKRTATSSFVLASAGWIFFGMALLYWLIDIKNNKSYAWVVAVVGMNPIFIYMLFETVGHQWVNNTIAIFIAGPLQAVAVQEPVALLISAVVTVIFYWFLCYWLYRKKIFFKV